MKDIKFFSEWDYKILEFVSKNEPVKMKQVKCKFKTLSAIEDRVNQLAEPKYSQFGIFVENTSVIIPTVLDNAITYKTTDLGKRILQDYKISKQNAKKLIWLKNAWIPIIVSFVTYMLLNYIIPRLLNLLKYFYDIF